MTPDDVAAIRAKFGSRMPNGYRVIIALCDALEAAWAENDYVIRTERAAIARVRALCDETERHPGKPWHVLSTAEVRAALDGDQ